MPRKLNTWGLAYPIHLQHMFTDSHEPFLVDREAYKFTPWKLRSFQLHVKDGLVPSYKIGGRRLFKKSEILAAMERCRVASRDEVLQ